MAVIFRENSMGVKVRVEVSDEEAATHKEELRRFNEEARERDRQKRRDAWFKERDRKINARTAKRPTVITRKQESRSKTKLASNSDRFLFWLRNTESALDTGHWTREAIDYVDELFELGVAAERLIQKGRHEEEDMVMLEISDIFDYAEGEFELMSKPLFNSIIAAGRAYERDHLDEDDDDLKDALIDACKVEVSSDNDEEWLTCLEIDAMQEAA